tara:strand:- start:251 stop:1330 length:1080 start_codon:yes stop_codon:yes gene_type:complete
MKTTFKLARKTTFYLGLLFLALLVTNCSNDDDQVTPEPPDYEFGEDFEEVDDLPEVTDEDPEFEEPETGSIEASEDTDALLVDVNEGEEISEENQAKLNSVSSYNETLPASAEESATSLTDEEIETILDAEELDEDLQSVQAELENAPQEIKNLLPVLNFDFDVDEEMAQAEFSGVAGTKLSISREDIVAQSVNGDCIAAADEAYDEVIADLQSQRDTQLASVESNYDRRLSEAETRNEARMEALDEYRTEVREMIINTSSQLLAAAVIAEDNDNDDLAKQLRLLSLFYAIDGRSKLNEWYTAASERIASTYEAEQATIEGIKEDREADVMAAYEAAEDDAQSVYNNVTASCHNQGSGN